MPLSRLRERSIRRLRLAGEGVSFALKCGIPSPGARPRFAAPSFGKLRMSGEGADAELSVLSPEFPRNFKKDDSQVTMRCDEISKLVGGLPKSVSLHRVVG